MQTQSQMPQTQPGQSSSLEAQELFDHLRSLKESTNLQIVAVTARYAPETHFSVMLHNPKDSTISTDKLMEDVLYRLASYGRGNISQRKKHEGVDHAETQLLEIPMPIIEAVSKANQRGFDVYLSLSDVAPNGDFRQITTIKMISENQRGTPQSRMTPQTRVTDQHVRLDMRRELINNWSDAVHKTQSASQR